MNPSAKAAKGRKLKRCMPVAMGLAFGVGANAQPLTSQNTLTPEQLVNTVLLGQGVGAINVLFNGQPANTVTDQIAAYTTGTSNLGIGNGMVMATGRAQVVDGGINWPDLFLPPAHPRNTPDPDLTIIMGTDVQKGVNVLEFDFIPTGDSIHFRFVFGSEEYPEYVCTPYNDGFGFFLSGPGISGAFSNGAVNLALVPGTNVPVAINTVNSGVPGIIGGNAATCAASDPNWQANSIYYVDNTGGSSVQLNGFTVPLEAKGAVQCGQVYHIKLAIANATDNARDSAVLIEGGSFASPGGVAIHVSTPDGSGTITEGCAPAVVTITRSNTTLGDTIPLSYGGAGITPGDLANAPGQVVLPPGTASISFPLQAVRDGQQEGAEEVVITAIWTSPCGYTDTATSAVGIREYQPMVLTAQDIHLDCDRDSVALNVGVSGGLGNVYMDWGAAGHGPTVYATGMEDGSYAVTATDQCPESASAVIRVFSGCELHIPNVITPNGDGKNDHWQIGMRASGGYAVRVFNRWGQEVFSSPNYGNDWSARNLPDGTYFYIVSGALGKEYTGHLTVLDNGRK